MKRTNKGKIVPLLAGGALLATLAAPSAMAASISSLFFPGQENLLSDNSAEYLVDKVVTIPGQVDVGDVLRGIFQIGTIEDPLGIKSTNTLGAGGNNELTGIFEFEVTGKVAFGAALPGAAPGILGTCLNLVCFTYGPSAAFQAEINALTGNDIAGIAIALFEDPTPDYTRTGTIAAGEASATNGTYRGALGFGLDPDEFVVSMSVSDNVTALGGVPLGSNTGTTNIQLSILQNLFGVQFGQVDSFIPTSAAGADGRIDVNGSGNIGGKSASSGFDFFDNFDFSVNVLPEPGSLALLGLGLAGLGMFARRRSLAV